MVVTYLLRMILFSFQTTLFHSVKSSKLTELNCGYWAIICFIASFEHLVYYFT